LKELLKAKALLKALQPEDAEILEHVAAVQIALGKRQEALDTLEEAVNLNPTDEAVAQRILESLKRLQPADRK
jgi:tetratricopeptide (TPR) repeat protein